MKNEGYSIVLTGLGGQGIISLLQILGNALKIEGYKVMTSETHGLSQRGGKVTCYLRFGKTLLSPIPMIGTADMIIALEESTILDVLKFVKPDKSTNLIIATYEKHEVGKEYPSLEYLLDTLYENSENIYFIPAHEIAVNSFGNLKTMNIVILGYILKFLPIKREVVETSLKDYFLGKRFELNLKALSKGQKLISKNF
ncbi:MAG: 2-oxoacid:acceptor oxidoreductase family protein [Promethearchaeota archaeon]